MKTTDLNKSSKRHTVYIILLQLIQKENQSNWFSDEQSMSNGSL